MLLSVIIPAYNAQKYIEACLDSVFASLAQWEIADEGKPRRLSEADYEVLVVDDGSTDRTPLILMQYAERHPNMRLFTQANQGQSVARNLAIEEAKGDYIYMVDADDEMMTQGLSLRPLRLSPRPLCRGGASSAENSAGDGSCNAGREGYDIIAVQVMYQQEDGTRRPWSHQMERWPFDQVFDTGAEFVRHHNIEGLVYGYLFRRQLFVNHPELRFTPGIYHQDEELIFKIFTLAGPTVYRRGYTYLYYERTGSSLNTHTEARRRKLMDDYLVILQRLVRWRDERGLSDVMHYKLSYLAMDLLRMLIRRQYDAAYATEVLSELRRLGLYPLPYLSEWKYLAMKALTCTPRLIKWWIGHPVWSRKVGF